VLLCVYVCVCKRIRRLFLLRLTSLLPLSLLSRYFTYLTDCKNPGACTILLRGGSKDVLNEVERNLTDALYVARNILVDPRLLPGGGAVEMSVAHHLMEKSKEYEGIAQYAYRSVSLALVCTCAGVANLCIGSLWCALLCVGVGVGASHSLLLSCRR
jgi:TCP-1/cpn60 chaperonin family